MLNENAQINETLSQISCTSDALVYHYKQKYADKVKN